MKKRHVPMTTGTVLSGLLALVFLSVDAFAACLLVPVAIPGHVAIAISCLAGGIGFALGAFGWASLTHDSAPNSVSRSSENEEGPTEETDALTK